jgi:outer membrane protein assembly factor BamB
MLKLFTPVVALALTAGTVSAQFQTRVNSHPLVPSTDALNRLNLKMAWRTYLPVEDSRDGVATVQIMGDRIYVQTRSGAVIAVNADTGQQVWRTRVGQPYNVIHPLGFNYNSVFGYNGSRLFAIDRATGRAKWETNLPNVPTTPPVADSQRAYVCLTGGKLVVYRLPIPEVDNPPPPVDIPGIAKPPAGPDKTKPPEGAPKSTTPTTGSRVSALGQYYASESYATSPLTSSSKPPQLTYTPLASATKTIQGLAQNYELPIVWDYVADSRIIVPPLVTMRKPETNGYLMFFSEKGSVLGSAKPQKHLIYSYSSESPNSAPMAQYGDVAYIAHEDATVVAMNIENGRILWRLAIGGTTRRQPVVTDDDVYIMPDHSGLYRLNRATGEVIWQNKTAERFLSANRKYVYASDGRGQLLILDRARGTQLTSFDMRDYTVLVSNDFTDRLFFTAHDGLLLCLYDRDFAMPAWNKQLVEEKKPEPPKKGEMEKPAAKEADK